MDNDKFAQFFTEECPIDHFYFGERGEEKSVVHLEGHMSARGFVVSLYHGGIHEEFDDYPDALRRMADVIEEYRMGAKT